MVIAFIVAKFYIFSCIFSPLLRLYVENFVLLLFSYHFPIYFFPVQCRFIDVNVHVPHYILFEFGFLFGICLMCIRCSILGTRSPMFTSTCGYMIHILHICVCYPCFHVFMSHVLCLLVCCSRISSAMSEAISFDSTLFKCAFDPIPVL